MLTVPLTRVDIDRGSVYSVQQASWAKRYNYRKCGSFVYVILKTGYFSSASFVFCIMSCLHFKGKISINLSDHLVFNDWKQTLAVCVLYEPLFLLKSRFREMSWVNVYLCLFRAQYTFSSCLFTKWHNFAFPYTQTHQNYII